MAKPPAIYGSTGARGRYETQADKVNHHQQYFFGVKDSIGETDETQLADMAALEAKYIEYTYTDPETSEEITTKYRYIDGTNPENKSWYIKLDTDGALLGSERVIRKALVVAGTVFFTSYVPDDNPCSGAGKSWLYAVDYKTGLPPTTPVFDINGDGKIDENDVVTDEDGNVIPIAGIPLFDPDGDGGGLASDPVLFGNTELFVNTTEGGLQDKPVNLPGLYVTLESWRHRF